MSRGRAATWCLWARAVRARSSNRMTVFQGLQNGRPVLLDATPYRGNVERRLRPKRIDLF